MTHLLLGLGSGLGLGLGLALALGLGTGLWSGLLRDPTPTPNQLLGGLVTNESLYLRLAEA